MQHSQGGGMGMQDMQRLQQQLQQAQFQRQQQVNNGAGGSNSHLMGHNNAMQAGQQFANQFSSPMSQPQNRGGVGGNTALAMMQQQNPAQPNQGQQQQQQQQPNLGSTGNNMSGNMQGSGSMASMFGSFGSMNQAMLQGNNTSSTMDASTGSSARLMAMAGMNMNQMGSANMSNRSNGVMDSSSTMQNMQAIMQQQAQQAAQKNQLQNQMGFGLQQSQQSQGGAQNPQQQMLNQGSSPQNNLMMRSADGTSGNQMNSQQMMLQQQLANHLQQMQGQQQQQPNNMNIGNRGNQMMQPNTSQNLLQQRQQQLLQQMQNQQRANGMLNQGMGGMNQGQDMNNMGMMQQMMQQQQQNNNMGMGLQAGNAQLNNLQQNVALQGAFARGPLTEQQLRIRQQNILRASSENQTMGADAAAAAQTVHGGAAGGVQAGNTGAADLGNNQANNNNNNQANNNMNNNNNNNPSGAGGGVGGGGTGGNDNASFGLGGGGGGQPGMDGSTNRQNAVGQAPPVQEVNAPLNDASTHSHSTRNSLVQQQQQQNGGRGTPAQQQKSFLDGNFAGGWQSNADLPDRRKVIFSILEVIKNMRPNTNTTSTKLPHMAKSLEEHLYRSAQTKEEYLDPKTLKQRLQTIAQGLDLHRAPGAPPGQGPFGAGGGMDTSRNSAQGGDGSVGGNNWNGQGPNNNMNNNNPNNSTNSNMMSQQQQQQLNNMQAQANATGSNVVDPWEGSQNGDQDSSSLMGGMQPPGGAMDRNSSVGWSNSSAVDMNNTNPIQGDDLRDSNSWNQQGAGGGGGGLNDANDPSQLMGGGGLDLSQMGQSANGNVINPEYPNTPKYQDAEAAQKRKVILQQQQRLLLLRHASKCKKGPTCTTKFCSQMVTLWKHMKTCRDKNCKTPHCLSSRCVLNHYRICKSQGKTATCEVCGPVMAKIKQNGREDGDPLAQQQQQQQPGGVQSLGGQQPQQQPSDPNMSLAARMMSNSQPQSATSQLQSSTGMPGADGVISQDNNQMGDLSQLSMQGNQLQQLMGDQQQQLQQQNPGMVGSGAGGGGVGGNDQVDQNQLQQLQQHQMKMQQQLESLKNLQGQQQQLLDQQGRLQEQSQMISDMNSPQAQQLRQQQMLLDQLQKRCQQQQLRLQQEIEMQSNAGGLAQAMQQQQQQPQISTSPIPTTADSGLPQLNPAADISSQSSVTSNSGIGMDDSTSRKKRRGSEKLDRGNSGKGRRGSTGGKGKALRQQLQEARASGDVNKINSLNLDAFAKKKALVNLNPKERAQKKKSAKANLAPLPGETSSLLSFMPRDMIMKHLESLNKRIRLSNRTVTHKCMPVVEALIEDQFGWVFHDPVDPVALGLPDYFEVVKNPMHLALVKKKLESAVYADMEQFARDVRLVFENAILYNGETSEVGELANTMIGKFDDLFRELVQGVETSQQNLESNGQACSLCGDQVRRYEPPVIHCRVTMQQIKRGATYFTDQTKSNNWSQAAYDAISPEDDLVLDDGTQIKKDDLIECKNDSLPEEAWVKCDECQCWVHQVCALFNDKTNPTNAKYSCPNCIMKRGDVVGFPVTGQKFTKGAEDLERCKMSDAIEEGLQRTLEDLYARKAKETGVDIGSVERAEGLTVRVLSSVEKKHQVGEEMVRRYEGAGCPTDFPVRSKCIGLFQKIHGVDTMLFAMYVYEYGQDCPAPNRRRVYISYIDSVKYFEPKCYRTTVYHSIVLEYLRYIKGRGFHTAHIWSCPPTPGDDYIFHVHPAHQLFPREDMLRTWYNKVFEKAKNEGIVIRTSTMYDEYFNSDTAPPEARYREDPLCLPYFEGDYIPGEIENIIKHLNDKGIGQKQCSSDEVMECLKQNVGKMKDNFIVVHLRNRRFAAAVERGEDVSAWLEDSDETLVRSKRAKISGKEARPTWSGGPTLNPFGDNTKAMAQSPSGIDTSMASDGRSKRSLDEIEPAISGHMAGLDRTSTVVGDTRDEDPLVESDLFESRQQFLNYCQTTHCQFDELRRAKHSTLMLLFQLHNPNASNRCETVPKFDLLEDGNDPSPTGDDMFKLDPFSSIDEGSDDANKSGEARQQALKADIELLEHAGTCSGSPGCQLQNCEKMKRLFEHVKTRDISGCRISTRLLSLCVQHARTCPVRGECPIPFCDQMRERNQRVRRQQQLMDERRRQAQNELYNTGGGKS